MKIDEYILDLDVDFKQLTFKGKETIKFKSDREKLSLNSAELEIESVRLGNEEIKFSTDEKTQTLHLQKEFSGDLDIQISFRGRISESLQGLYIARYSKGEYMLSTQFESTGARFLFPCVDHPAYKAKFSLNLTIDHGLDAISNMPQSSVTQLENGKTLVRFHQTPPMSTYLIYIGIGHLEERSIKASGYECILAAPRGLLNSSDVPIREAISFIGEYENYFGVKYVLPKVHLIAVPEFAAGAMENWGAITFREVLLMLNKETSTSVKQTVSEVIAHELAHQWFGNLVTMKWWNDLWLNESFATFMAFKMVDRTHGEWEFMNRFIQSETAGALNGDSLVNTHPIDADVRNPDEVAQIFDEISYGKGASILRMIENYVGEEKFRDGIRIYLKKYQYGNAMGSDLWNCIEEASGMPISRIMEAWIKRKGYPLILAESVNGKLKLRQKRFMLNGEDSESLWPVPLFVKRTKGNERILFETREIEIEDNGVLKLNDSQIGFYRVMYSDELWKKISSSFSILTRLDFRELLSDLFAFLKSGNLVLEEYMRRLEPFMDLDDYVVVEDLAGQLFTLSSILPENEKLNSMAVSYFRKHLESLGEKRKGEADYISILRSNLSVYLASTDLEYDRRMVADFPKLFDIDPDIRAAVAISEARTNNNFNSLIDKYRLAGGDEDRIKILSGIGWLSGAENNLKTLQMIDQNTIKKQDILRVYTSMAANPANRAKVFEEIPKAMDIMEKNFRGTAYPGMMAEMIIPVVGLGRENDMKKLAESIKKPSNQNGVNKGLETLDIYSRLVRNSKR